MMTARVYIIIIDGSHETLHIVAYNLTLKIDDLIIIHATYQYIIYGDRSGLKVGGSQELYIYLQVVTDSYPQVLNVHEFLQYLSCQ